MRMFVDLDVCLKACPARIHPVYRGRWCWFHQWACVGGSAAICLWGRSLGLGKRIRIWSSCRMGAQVPV